MSLVRGPARHIRDNTYEVEVEDHGVTHVVTFETQPDRQTITFTKVEEVGMKGHDS